MHYIQDTITSNLLNISSDIYIVVDISSLKLLDFNPAFTKMGFEDLVNNAEIFLSKAPYATHFLGLQNVINTQKNLIKNNQNIENIPKLPLGNNENTPHTATARLVHFFEENNAALVQICIEKNVDSTLKIDLNNLERRDTLLKATSLVAQKLLSNNEDFHNTINNVLGILGNATNVDRVYVWNIHKAPNPSIDDRLYTSQLYEWSEGAEPQQGNDIVTNLLVEEGIPTWIDTFLAGKCVNSLVKNMHPNEREVLEAQGIISILTAPIIFHGHLWGFIGFDNCHAEYTWSPAEEDILRSAGTLISTAIYSRRTNEALYEAQERFCGVEEATGDIIWSVDKNQNINYISQRLKAVLQYDPQEIIGKPFSTLLLHPEEFHYIATKENFIMRDFELRAICKDGSTKWLRSSCKYSFDEQGKLLYGFGSSSDITHVHEAQEALRIANKELEEAIKIAHGLAESAHRANEIKSNFLANMSHEIRTPMNAVVGITHLLQHTELTPQQREYLDRISDSSISLLHIINDILDFSKTQDGKLVIETQSFAIKDLMKDIEATAKEWAKEKSLQFSLDIAPEVDDTYIGDDLRLNQILISLITNAIKFTNEGSVKLSVQVDVDSKDSTILHFTVQDTGIGISQEQINMLFQDFTQADISSTRRFGGIGLGLALCKNLTILMGGDIWCDSTLGEGSTFHFTCRLNKDIQKYLMLPRELKDTRILAAMPNVQEFEALQAMLLPIGYTNLIYTSDIITIKKQINSNETADAIILHHDFSEAVIIESILIDDDAYFNHIPIIYYTKEQSRFLPNGFTVIERLDPSTLHDCFISLLGNTAEADQEISQQGFENLLRLEHSGKKILLVEDNEINQMIAQSILEDVGLNVTVASDGSEGVEAIGKDKFDLVIMDIQMPKMDGLSATRKIRENAQYADIPIIALTAHATEEDREKSLSAGMNDHTTKPIDATQLFKTLLYWLSISKK